MDNRKIALIMHACCVSFQISSGQNYNAVPDEKEIGLLYSIIDCMNEHKYCLVEEVHKAWLDYKIKDGWVYGIVENAEQKTSPNIVEFRRLPLIEKRKRINYIVAFSMAKSILEEIGEK